MLTYAMVFETIPENQKHYIYVCGKSEVCKNFLQRKVELD